MADPQDQPNTEPDGESTPPAKKPPAKAAKKAANPPAKKAPAKKAPAKKAPAKKAPAKKSPAKQKALHRHRRNQPSRHSTCSSGSKPTETGCCRERCCGASEVNGGGCQASQQ